MNWNVFIAIAVVLVVGWAINIPIEAKYIRERTPSSGEIFLSLLMLAAGIGGSYLLVKYWNRLTSGGDDVDWFVGLAFAVVVGAVLEVIMSARAAGKAVDKVPLYDLATASAIAIPIFCGLWAELRGDLDVGTIPLAITAGYGWKGFFSDVRKDQP